MIFFHILRQRNAFEFLIWPAAAAVVTPTGVSLFDDKSGLAPNFFSEINFLVSPPKILLPTANRRAIISAATALVVTPTGFFI